MQRVNCKTDICHFMTLLQPSDGRFHFLVTYSIVRYLGAFDAHFFITMDLKKGRLISFGIAAALGKIVLILS